MSRYAGFSVLVRGLCPWRAHFCEGWVAGLPRLGLVVIAALMIGGCSSPEPEPSPPAAQPASPAKVSPETEPAAPPADQLTPEKVPETPAADSPSAAGAAAPETPAAETKPSALGAIGRAVRSSLGATKDDEPSDAPAYRPQ